MSGESHEECESFRELKNDLLNKRRKLLGMQTETKVEEEEVESLSDSSIRDQDAKYVKSVSEFFDSEDMCDSDIDDRCLEVTSILIWNEKNYYGNIAGNAYAARCNPLGGTKTTFGRDKNFIRANKGTAGQICQHGCEI